MRILNRIEWRGVVFCSHLAVCCTPAAKNQTGTLTTASHGEASPYNDKGELTAPSTITVPSYTAQNSVTFGYVPGGGTSFVTHNIKACRSFDCNTGCLDTMQDLSPPATVSGLVAGQTYYLCMQSIDLSAHTTPWVSSANYLTVDTTPPLAVSSVEAPTSGQSGIAIVFESSPDRDIDHYNVQACAANDCTSSCEGLSMTTSSPAILALASLKEGRSYYSCVQAEDAAGNTSPYITSVSTSTLTSGVLVPK